MTSSTTNPLPEGFVYLADINPDIVQAIRYSGPENALGRPLNGYKANKVIVTRQLADKLNRIQLKLQNDFNLCLVVYDSYRPRRAVEDFWQWSHMPPIGSQGKDIQQSAASGQHEGRQASDTSKYDPDAMAAKYFPKFRGTNTLADLPTSIPLNNNSFNRMLSTQTRATLFEKGYISKRSNHARGSTVDVTIVQWEKRGEVHVDKIIPVVNRGGILHFRDSAVPMTPSKAVCNTLDASSLRGQLIHLPEFKAFDQLISEHVQPKLSEAQTQYLQCLEKEVMDAAHNAGDRPRGESVEGFAKGMDKYGQLPFIDDRTIDMGTSFDLFDLASHPLWPHHFRRSAAGPLLSIAEVQQTDSGSRGGGGNSTDPFGTSPSQVLQQRQSSLLLGEGSHPASLGATPPSLGSSMIRQQQRKLAESSSDAILRSTTERAEGLPMAVLSHPTFLLRRLFLQSIFEEEGFEISEEEWWHFWLKDGEPFPPKEDDPEFGFDFDVE